jgi:hypothetical protein
MSAPLSRRLLTSFALPSKEALIRGVGPAQPEKSDTENKNKNMAYILFIGQSF